MHKPFLSTAALLGALSVILGAIAAHALKEKLAPHVFEIFETSVRYQFYHVFALLAAGILYHPFPNKKILWSGSLFMAGIILFCGSLYALTYLEAIGNLNLLWIGAITPIGGVCFIMGWIFLAIGVLQKQKSI